MKAREARGGRKEANLYRALTGAMAVAAAFTLPLACGEDEEPALGMRGEFCLSRTDCSSGLACMDNTCVLFNFGLKAAAKECVAIQCLEAEDCCPEPPVICPSYEAQCELAPDSLICDEYERQCVCQEENWECSEGQCIEHCDSVGDECVTGGKCNGTDCVDCVEDDDCLSTEECTNDVCETVCEEDEDCPLFHSCESRRCEYTGCATDRECVAARKDIRAFCDDEKICQVPCQADIECDNPYEFGNMACIAGLCANLGCESDEECRVQMSGSRTILDAVCREKEEPEEETGG